jgi:hypothetical protein
MRTVPDLIDKAIADMFSEWLMIYDEDRGKVAGDSLL